MTNEQIIFEKRCELMDAGIIGTTGRYYNVVDEDGNEKRLMEPEEIHTFSAWKALGYGVKRKEKAVAKFPIWKYVEKKKEAEEQEEERVFLKMSCFFSFSQVEKMGE
jgi:predicted transcriptional regulator